MAAKRVEKSDSGQAALSGARWCVWLLLLLATATGCPEKEPQPSAAPPKPTASVPLKVLVVDDPSVGQAIELLQGEWRVQGGGALTVEQTTRDAALTAGQADLLVFPPSLLGQLCEEQRLRPVREGTLADKGLQYQDIYPVVRDRLLSYGGKVMALPLGCPTPVLAYVPEEADAPPPATWQALGDSPVQTVCAFDETETLAQAFLARAISYAASDTSEAVLFNPQTLEPSLIQPPFQRALEEVVAAAAANGADPQDPSQTLPTEPGAAAIAWPVRTADATPNSAVQIAPLPGTSQRWEQLSREWEYLNEPQRLTLLGAGGRLIAVSCDSRNAAAAFKLAAWLAGPANARQLATASPMVANVRSPLGVLPDDWSGSGDRRLGRAFSSAARESFLSGKAFVFPRILRSEAYVTVLGEAVQAACAGESSPEQALTAAADRWRQITEEVGLERQKQAYLRHLGLLSYTPQSR